MASRRVLAGSAGTGIGTQTQPPLLAWAIWENYAGWFHHESTTELYSVPRKSIHGDLIELAGGKKALVDRAVLKLSEGHLEQAVHLLDIVLSEGDDAAAIEAMIEAHEKLLAESKNFWLSAWLTNEAGKLRTRKP